MCVMQDLDYQNNVMFASRVSPYYHQDPLEFSTPDIYGYSMTFMNH